MAFRGVGMLGPPPHPRGICAYFRCSDNAGPMRSFKGPRITRPYSGTPFENQFERLIRRWPLLRTQSVV
eukprot:13824525-Alexandrium_andersonii.AAC.1